MKKIPSITDDPHKRLIDNILSVQNERSNVVNTQSQSTHSTHTIQSNSNISNISNISNNKTNLPTTGTLKSNNPSLNNTNINKINTINVNTLKINPRPEICEGTSQTQDKQMMPDKPNINKSNQVKTERNLLDDSEFRKSKTKHEKIEISSISQSQQSQQLKHSQTEVNKVNRVVTKEVKTNKVDILKNGLSSLLGDDPVESSLDNSNLLSNSLYSNFDDSNLSLINEDKYNNIFENNLLDEYYEVYNFLESINLHKKYFNTFIQNQYLDMQSIFTIDDKHLDIMKIKGGSKAKILNKIREMKDSAKKLLEEINGNRPNTASGTNNNQHNYDDNVGTSNMDNIESISSNKGRVMNNTNKLNSDSGVGTEEIKKNTTKYQELYDEEEQRRLFQEAVLEFRTGSKVVKNDFNSKMNSFNQKLEREEQEKRDRIKKEKEKEKSIKTGLNVIL